MVSTPKPSTAWGEPSTRGRRGRGHRQQGERAQQQQVAHAAVLLGLRPHQHQERDSQHDCGDHGGVDSGQPRVVVPAVPAQQGGRGGDADRHHRGAHLHGDDGVDRGESFAEIRRNRGRDVLDDLGAVLGVLDEPNPQPVAVVDVLLGEGLGGPQRRSVHEAQGPPAAALGLQRRLTELPQPAVDDLQQRVRHDRDRGVGVQQDADLNALAGHDADHYRPRLRDSLDISLWCFNSHYRSHRPTAPFMVNE